MMKFRDLIYDIEVYPNLFTCAIICALTGKKYLFEISERRNDIRKLIKFMQRERFKQTRMVGFNNLSYDYPVIHYIYKMIDPNFDARRINYLIYKKSNSIIDTEWNNRFSNVVWDDSQVIPQIDLMKVHHFDNVARATSLKILEFNMNAKSIQDLPYKPGTKLKVGHINNVIRYNFHDVEQTLKFYELSRPMLEFRQTLTEKYNRNFMNHNDTKIGKDYFVMCLEERLGKTICYDYEDGQRKIRQTKRPSIDLSDVIFKAVEFKTRPFQLVLEWLKSQVITDTKGVFTEIPESKMQDLLPYCNNLKIKKKIKNLNCILDGFQFDFGTGGIHGSVESQSFESDDEWMIWDWDVTSYYPSLAIVNKVYPKHLGPEFCHIYKEMKDQRVSYPKGSPENAMLKLALNGVYGDSNNQFSPFFDPKYTMTITVNGQLLLCMLYEQLRTIPDLRLLQINTDGLTIRVRRRHKEQVIAQCDQWSAMTGLDLENVEYTKMFIRDVNNYIAVYDGGVKRKGAYEYKLAWHQNHNSLVVPKAAEAYLVYGEDIETFIKNHKVDFDFFRRTKVPRTSRLETYDEIWDENTGVIQNTSRYYIAKEGVKLDKIMPPLARVVNPYLNELTEEDEYARYQELLMHMAVAKDSRYSRALEVEDRVDMSFDEKVQHAFERHIGIDKEWNVEVCNDDNKINWENLNYDFYIEQAYRLVEPVCNNFMEEEAA